MKPDLNTLSTGMLLYLVLLVVTVSCSGTSGTGDTSSSPNTTTTTEQSSSEDTVPNDATQQAQATTDNASPTTLSPDPAFDPLLPTLQQMTTAPIVLPTSLPPKVGDVAIEQDPNENPYTTGGDKYTILFLPSTPDPSQIVRPYVHYMTLGRLTASPASTPLPDPTNGLGTPQQLEDVTLPDGTAANLERLEPPQGANYGPFTVGTFEEEGYRYTVLFENDSTEGDATRQILSTMVRVASNT
jgi:hypothetical protein